MESATRKTGWKETTEQSSRKKKEVKQLRFRVGDVSMSEVLATRGKSVWVITKYLNSH